MPRFAILDHDHPFRHWDFLIEAGAVLRAWRLLAEPEPNRPISTELLPDHRPHYLDYEGPISGDRGRVVRWDGGTFDWELDGADEVRVRLVGGHIVGVVTLRRSPAGWIWLWREPDAPAR
jgi:hypothetical protein